MPGIFDLPEPAPLSIVALAINLVLGLLLALVLRWHFRRYGSTISNRAEFSRVFPFILLTTTLIISIVKSSLALSLGLVGALSIVRFRTPIKEPEELAYLFMAIAMGLGLGADQRIPTFVAGLIILGVMALIQRAETNEGSNNLFLSLEWRGSGDQDRHLDLINEVMRKHVNEAELHRFETRENGIEVTYFVDVGTMDILSGLTSDLKDSFPGIGVTAINQKQMPSL